jgi:hypothetical protein
MIVKQPSFQNTVVTSKSFSAKHNHMSAQCFSNNLFSVVVVVVVAHYADFIGHIFVLKISSFCYYHQKIKSL